jgi:hypothetical protein
MRNYRDLSTGSNDVSAGFQFEFYCEVCAETWRSDFKPYRTGQLTGWLTRFAFMFTDLYKIGRATGTFSDAGANQSKAKALDLARETAAQRFDQCNCRKWVCHRCWDSNLKLCAQCVQAKNDAANYAQNTNSASNNKVSACPSCQTPSQGGRFCHDCGFDMASSHKNCPGCGATVMRQARFCTDCGHGF